MPRTNPLKTEELDDGGFMARPGKPLAQFLNQTGSLHMAQTGKQNYKRKYGGKKTVLPLVALQTEFLGADTEEGTASQPVSVTADSAGDAFDQGSASQKQTVTLTGTIKRGRKQDQVVEVHFEIPEKDLRKMKAKNNEERCCTSKLSRGPHVIVFTLLFCPIAFVVSIFTTFYIGTLCWYNVYLYISEERTVWHKIFLCPLLLIAYPVLITVSTLCLSVVAAARQISWRLSSWCCELRDTDKGFFVWLCNALNIPQCSPYEVVIVDEKSLTENVAEQQGFASPSKSTSDADLISGV